MANESETVDKTSPRHAFQAETRQLLDIVIHSLYSNKEIFLRELISNASDALDRLRFDALTEPALIEDGEVLEIRIDADAEARTLSISDNGVGMSRDEVIENLGTIAKSGTREMLRQAQDAGGDASQLGALIGQFGVGFYSTFMVADEVTVVTRRAGEERATRWQSSGDGEYTLEEDRRFLRGTTITLKLKPVDEDHGIEDYTDSQVLDAVILVDRFELQGDGPAKKSTSSSRVYSPDTSVSPSPRRPTCLVGDHDVGRPTPAGPIRAPAGRLDNISRSRLRDRAGFSITSSRSMPMPTRSR